MGLLGSLGSLLKSGASPDPDYLKYVTEQQSGCGARVYPKGKDTSRPRRDLFWEILDCNSDRSITDVAGSFTMTLKGTEPWDEILFADDLIRIFYGDRLATFADDGGIKFNFASGNVKQSTSDDPDLQLKSIGVPIPGMGPQIDDDGKVSYENKEATSVLLMDERFVGKISRVEKNAGAGTATTGPNVTYTVTGVALGACIQDISLYYNQFLSPLNAVSIFFGTRASLTGSPSELVKQALALVLTSVPFPQWVLPEAFVKDMNYTDPGSGESLKLKNLTLIQDKLTTYEAEIAKVKATSTFKADYGSIEGRLNSLINQSGSISDTHMLVVVSLDGIKPTFGTNFDSTFLNSVTTGLWDLLKHLSNEPFNEMWLDLCPNGDPDSGGDVGVMVPTVVLRQRPYNITPLMLENTTDRLEPYKKNIDYFSVGANMGAMGDSLFTLMDNGNSFSVYGPCDGPVLDNTTGTQLDKYMDTTVVPSLLDYKMGYSGHDRVNAFLVVGAFSTGAALESQKRFLAQNGSFRLDPESVQDYGLRMMELSTPYAQPTKNGSGQSVDCFEVLKDFSQTLSNWYFMNPVFLNGSMTCAYLPDARLGVACKYWETRITADNPFRKAEISYVQGISDTFRVGELLRTSLTLIRGIRYNLDGVEFQESFGGVVDSSLDVSALTKFTV